MIARHQSVEASTRQRFELIKDRVTQGEPRGKLEGVDLTQELMQAADTSLNGLYAALNHGIRERELGTKIEPGLEPGEASRITMVAVHPVDEPIIHAKQPI
jgi:hypothetical protein